MALQNLKLSPTIKRTEKLNLLMSGENLDEIKDYITTNDPTTIELQHFLRSQGVQASRSFVGELLTYASKIGIVYTGGTKHRCVCGYCSDNKNKHSGHVLVCYWCKVLNDLVRNDWVTLSYVADRVNNKQMVVIDIAKEVLSDLNIPDNKLMWMMKIVKNKLNEAIDMSLVDKNYYESLVKTAQYGRSAETIKKKYGVDNISQLDEIKEKKKETCRKNFGVDHPMQSAKVRAKSEKTLIAKYGVTNISKLAKIKQQKIHTLIKNIGLDDALTQELIQIHNREPIKTYSRYGYRPTPDNIAKSLRNGLGKRTILISPGEYKLVDDLKKRLNEIGIDDYELFHNMKVFQFGDHVYQPDIVLYVNNLKIIIEHQTEYHKSGRIKKFDNKKFELFVLNGYKCFAVWPNDTYNEDIDKIIEYIELWSPIKKES